MTHQVIAKMSFPFSWNSILFDFAECYLTISIIVEQVTYPRNKLCPGHTETCAWVMPSMVLLRSCKHQFPVQRSVQGSVRQDFPDQTCTCLISALSSAPRWLGTALSAAHGPMLDAGLVWPGHQKYNQKLYWRDRGASNMGHKKGNFIESNKKGRKWCSDI